MVNERFFYPRLSLSPAFACGAVAQGAIGASARIFTLAVSRVRRSVTQAHKHEALRRLRAEGSVVEVFRPLAAGVCRAALGRKPG